MKKSCEILHSSLVEKFNMRYSLPRTLIFYQKTFLDLSLAWCLFSVGSCLFLFEFFHYSSFAFLPLVGQCSAAGNPNPLPKFICLLGNRLQTTGAPGWNNEGNSYKWRANELNYKKDGMLSRCWVSILVALVLIIHLIWSW